MDIHKNVMLENQVICLHDNVKNVSFYIKFVTFHYIITFSEKKVMEKVIYK